MIACLGRMHEFEAHFRGALAQRAHAKELSAVLRQVAIYCGFPAAVDCHRVAKQVLAAEAKKLSGDRCRPLPPSCLFHRCAPARGRAAVASCLECAFIPLH